MKAKIAKEYGGGVEEGIKCNLIFTLQCHKRGHVCRMEGGQIPHLEPMPVQTQSELNWVIYYQIVWYNIVVAHDVSLILDN